MAGWDSGLLSCNGARSRRVDALFGAKPGTPRRFLRSVLPPRTIDVTTYPISAAHAWTTRVSYRSRHLGRSPIRPALSRRRAAYGLWLRHAARAGWSRGPTGSLTGWQLDRCAAA